MDWDWHLIVELAILVVATTGTTLIWAERTIRRRERGLPTVPHPHGGSSKPRRATGRRYACAVSPDGILTITPAHPGLETSAETAG